MSAELLAELKQAGLELAELLAQSHGHLMNLIMSLENTELDPVQKLLVATARHELALDQNAFLAKFGNYAKPGVN
jgi:hypothetical protein